MKVGELIAFLEGCDPNSPVVFELHDHMYTTAWAEKTTFRYEGDAQYMVEDIFTDEGPVEGFSEPMPCVLIGW